MYYLYVKCPKKTIFLRIHDNYLRKKIEKAKEKNPDW